MLGIALEFLLKGLGFGKMVLGILWDIIKGIFGFAVEKPFQFLTIVLSLALVYAGWYGANTTRELTQTKKIVDEKVQFIEKQGKTITEYTTALDKEKKNHVADIKKSNNAVDSLKKAADQAKARAEAAAQAVKKDQVKFDKLAGDYGRYNPSTGKPQDRIKREEATNDSFIKAWKEAGK